MSRAAEPALPPSGADDEPCHACDARLAGDQRYCLHCGARRGRGGPIDFAGLLAGHEVARPAPAARAPRALRTPLPVAATMLLALLLTGIVLGSLTSPRTLADAGARPVDVVMPSIAATTTPATPQPAPHVPVTPPAQPPAPAAAEPSGATSAPAQPSDADSTTPPGEGDASTTTGSGPAGAGTAASPVKHVFVIRLGEAPVPYPFAAPGSHLATALVPQGTLLRDLRTVAGGGLADAIALLSGQGPNAQTLAGCPVYGDVTPATIAADGQEQGEGCVYSAQTATLLNQLDAQSLTWRAYLEDQARGGPGVAASCRRPTLGAADPWRDSRPGDAYVTARNPFVYFHAITDSPTCASAVVDLAQLDADLAAPEDALPAFSYIVPNACHDGRPIPCAPGAPAGIATADAFLAELLPKIASSKAYADALVVVSFDRAFTPPPAPGPDGGAKVGALLLSPLVARGRTLGGRYDTYSLLAAIEDVFGLDHLGHAAKPTKRLGTGIYERSQKHAITLD